MDGVRPRAAALGGFAGNKTNCAARFGDRPAPRGPLTTALVRLRREAYSPPPIENWAGGNCADWRSAESAARPVAASWTDGAHQHQGAAMDLGWVSHLMGETLPTRWYRQPHF